MAKYSVGDKVYFVESNRIVREVVNGRCSGGMYIVKFPDDDGIRLREHRLFSSKEEAEASIRNRAGQERKIHSPYDYGY